MPRRAGVELCRRNGQCQAVGWRDALPPHPTIWPGATPPPVATLCLQPCRVNVAETSLGRDIKQPESHGAIKPPWVTFPQSGCFLCSYQASLQSVPRTEISDEMHTPCKATTGPAQESGSEAGVSGSGTSRKLNQQAPASATTARAR